ncbi:MAG: membrane protein insertion efficiency factor YidD [Mycoplasmatales bacterium]
MLKKITIFIPLFIIRFYRYVISPHIRSSCRFDPTCSVYAVEAYQTHGFFKGTFLTFKRIFSCHPWGGYGYDPVPEKKEKDDKPK